MNKVEHLLNILEKDKNKKHKEIEKEIEIKLTDISILKKYLPEIRELINRDKNKKSAEEIEENNKKIQEQHDLFFRKKKDQSKKFDELEKNYSNLQKSYENINNRFFSDLKKELAKNNEKELIKIADYHFGKIDNTPVRTIWKRVNYSLFFILLITLFFESYIIYGYQTMHQYTPNEIKELEKYQVDKSLIWAKHPNFVVGKIEDDSFISDDMRVGFVKWKK